MNFANPADVNGIGSTYGEVSWHAPNMFANFPGAKRRHVLRAAVQYYVTTWQGCPSDLDALLFLELHGYVLQGRLP
jgi:hypothetical protein